MNEFSVGPASASALVTSQPYDRVALTPSSGSSERGRGRWLGAWIRRRVAGGVDSGMSTAEYAVGTVAACGFAALLYKVLTGGAVTDAMTELLNRALHAV